MARVAIQWKRQEDGDFKAIGVWFATPKALQSRVLPGQRMDAWFSTIHQMASPPLIENGTMPGTWEDFIEYALDALSNGHDLMVSEVPAELTLDRTYAKWVLGLEGAALNKYSPSTIPNVSTIPANELEGAGKGMAPVQRFAEGSSADDHPYGPWTGGAKSSGGRPGGGGSAEKPGLKDARKRVEQQGLSPYDTGDNAFEGFNEGGMRTLMESRGHKWAGEPGSLVDMTSPVDRKFVVRGKDGLPGAFVTIDTRPASGPKVSIVSVFKGKQGRGHGSALYDAVQDTTDFNMYQAIGQSKSFTTPGKAFAKAWLQSRKVRFAEADAPKKWTVQMALDALEKAPIDEKSGVRSPEEE